MPKKSYSELLKDPRWQKKRLEIMERDDFACTKCGTQDKTLNVHHTYYSKDKMPWEYGNRTLITLCEDCHEKETKEIKSATSALLDVLYSEGCMSEEFYALSAFIKAIGMISEVKEFFWYLEDMKEIKDSIKDMIQFRKMRQEKMR